MSDLPPGWEWATLGELVAADGHFSDGDWVESKDQDPDGGVRLVQLADIGDGHFRDRSDRSLTTEKAHELRCHFLGPGDVLIARMPEPLGRTCIYPGGSRPAVTVVDVCILRPGNNSVDPRWLMWCINSPSSRAQIEAMKTGTTRKRISRSNLSKIRLPVAPLGEQRRVAAALEDHLSRVDVGRLTLQSAERRVRSAFVASLSHMIKSLSIETWMRLGDLSIDRRYGTSVKCSYEGPGMPILRIPNVQSGQIDLSDIKHASVQLKELDHLWIREGDVLFVRTNGSKNLIGRSAVADHDLDHAFASYLIRFRFDPSAVRPKWIQLVLESPQLRTQIEEVAASSAGQYNLSISKLSSLEVPLPSLKVQSVLIEQFSELKATLSRLSAEISTAQFRAERLRRSLLADAFAGRLVPQDPDDEPASVLLERSRAERSVQSKSKRTRRTGQPDIAREALL